MEQSIEMIYAVICESGGVEEWESEIKSKISSILTAYKADRNDSEAYSQLCKLADHYTGNIDILQEACGQSDEDIVNFLNDVVDK